MKNVLYFTLFLLIFLVFPFGGFVISLFMLFRSNISKGQQNVCLIILSLFWGILAFTQKSLASVNTDCIRYYYEFEFFEMFSPIKAITVFDIRSLLNFVFYPISAFVVALTGNVQSISFLWTFIVYFLTFLSVRKLMKYYDCYTNRNFAILVICLMFCFIAFVQVSELLKQASAFAVFFYGFTLFMVGESKVAVLFLIIAAIGLHPSSIMLLPLFLYNRVRTWFLLIFAMITIVASHFIDVIGLLMSFLPGGNYTGMIIDRFGGGSSEGGTLHYIVLQLLMVCPAVLLWLTGRTKVTSLQNAVNVILLYFTVASLNFTNLIAYLRFAIFAHWLFALVYVLCLKNIRFKEVKVLLNVVIFCMFFMTMRWTEGRTTPGGYASSYMENSIVNIVFSTSYDYLKVDYTN